MGSRHLSLGEQYRTARYAYSPLLSKHYSQEAFEQRAAAFLPFDDVRSYARHFGEQDDPLIPLNDIQVEIILKTDGHLRRGYAPCAISSGETTHINVLDRRGFTTEDSANLIGSDLAKKQIRRNNVLALARTETFSELLPHMAIVPPTKFEAATRLLQEDGDKVIGTASMKSPHYMNGIWYPGTIDKSYAMILDDVLPDRRSTKDVEYEIAHAQTYTTEARKQYRVTTTDWFNSRNGILEMARGEYIHAGIHPLRLDAAMEMWRYDEESGLLYPATLLDNFKAVVQGMSRWAAQGIITEEWVWTASRFIELHRRRMAVPEQFAAAHPTFKNPTAIETKEFNRLIEDVEPFILEYLSPMIMPEGLPDYYQEAYDRAPVKISYQGSAITATSGREVSAWLKKSIPMRAALDLYEASSPTPVTPDNACEVRSPLCGKIKPVRPRHDFDGKTLPFVHRNKNEIWPDHPYDDLDKMSQQLARMLFPVFAGLANPTADAPFVHGIHYDLKRAGPAFKKAADNDVADLSRLPGAMGSCAFKKDVVEPNRKQASRLVEQLRWQENDDAPPTPMRVISSPMIAEICSSIADKRDKMTGPGPRKMSPTFRLAMEQELLRNVYTHYTLYDGWEKSGNACRLMAQATKIEFGLIERAGGNNTELSVLSESEAHYLSLYDRYEKIRLYLSQVIENPTFRKSVAEKDSKALSEWGDDIRNVSATLAFLIEIDDCLVDPDYNNGHFQQHLLENSREFLRNQKKIQETKHETVTILKEQFAWLWNDEILEHLRADYRDAWYKVYGLSAQVAGPPRTTDTAIEIPYPG